jgi:hypothetical protein
MSMGWNYVSELHHQWPCRSSPDDIWVWRAMVEWYRQGGTEELGEKPAPMPLCPPQIPHRLTRTHTRISAVRDRWLIAWAMARPKIFDLIFTFHYVWKHFRKLFSKILSVFSSNCTQYQRFKIRLLRWYFSFVNIKYHTGQNQTRTMYVSMLAFVFCSKVALTKVLYESQHSPHFTRKSLRGAVVRFGGKVYCWVD